MSSVSQEIKERLDLVEFLRQYLSLSPAGKNLKALCPFHSEKTPSFMVSPERQIWHCFGCNEGGDIFKFLMKQENLEFHEALKVLAEKAGVELKRVSPTDQKQFGVLYDINESAKDFFKHCLAQNKDAQEYLKKRGLTEETIKEFELGAAPADFDELTVYLVNLGYDVKDIERAGLNLKSERGGYLDRFRGRIMFPLYNAFGKVVGFSGRILPQFETADVGKYVNSPETPIFSKSRLLYGFHKSKNDVRKSGAVFVVEGQMDFLMSWQAEAKNTVAVSGTALSADTLKSLRRLTDRVYFGLDKDEAGFRALEKMVDSAHSFDFSVSVVDFGEFKDAAEAASAGVLKGKIKAAEPALAYFFKWYLPEGGDVHSKKIAVRELLKKIRRVKSAVERSQWLKELANFSAVEEKALYEEMESLPEEKETATRREITSGESFLASERRFSRLELIIQKIVSFILGEKELAGLVGDHLDFFPPLYKKIYRVIIMGESENGDRQISDLLTFLALKSTFELAVIEPLKRKEEFLELLEQLKTEYFKERRRLVSLSIKAAEDISDHSTLENHLKEFREISYEEDKESQKEN